MTPNPTKQNPIMAKSLIHYNFIAAKKKATQEEDIKTEIPQIPKYEKPKVAILSAGMFNLVRQILP